MNADTDLQVWLETSSLAQTSIIIPHVQSDTEKMLSYRIMTTREGPSGRSSIGQSGEIRLKPDQATALSRLALQREGSDKCHITLILSLPNAPERHYEFSCPGEDPEGRKSR